MSGCGSFLYTSLSVGVVCSFSLSDCHFFLLCNYVVRMEGEHQEI
jgi:hypothetical protein